MYINLYKYLKKEGYFFPVTDSMAHTHLRGPLTVPFPTDGMV